MSDTSGAHERARNEDGASNGDSNENTEENREHLQNVEDGCGCTEVWEHLSEQREENAQTS